MLGTLRVNLSVKSAFCTDRDCDASWDEDTIGVLGEYIRTATEGKAA